MASQYSTTEGSKNSSSDEILHSRFSAPGYAARPPTSSSSSSKYDDDSSWFTPPPKTDQQHKKDNKKKKQPSPPAFITNNSAATKMSAKRPREDRQEEEEEENGVREPPTLKKTLHAVQQESPPKENKKKKPPKQESVSTPHSPQKSLRKVAQRWNPKDELAFLNGLLAFCERGKGLPKTIAPVYDHIRNTLDNHYSNRQLSDKSSRWKAKFRAAQDKMKDNTFQFKNPHEAAMYNICKQLWGEPEEGGAENEENNEDHSIGGCDAENVFKASMNGNGKENKKRRKPVLPKEKDGEEDMLKPEDQEYQGSMNGKEEKKKKKRRRKPTHGEEDMQKPEDEEFQGGKRDEDQEDQRVKEEEVEDQEDQWEKKVQVEYQEDQRERIKEEEKGEEEDEEGEDEDGSKSEKAVAMNVVENVAHDSRFREEMNAMVAGLKNAAVIILKESELRSRAMIESHFNSRTDHLQSLNNERINGFHSAGGSLILNRVKTEALEQKWREQQILEIEAYSKRLDLLQEECKVRLEELKAPVRNGGY